MGDNMTIPKGLINLAYHFYSDKDEAIKNKNKYSFLYPADNGYKAYFYTKKNLIESYKTLDICDICNENKALKNTTLLYIFNYDDAVLSGNYHIGICKSCKDIIIK